MYTRPHVINELPISSPSNNSTKTTPQSTPNSSVDYDSTHSNNAVKNTNNDSVRWVRADQLDLGNDKVLFSISGTDAPYCGPYTDAWSLDTPAGSYRVNNFSNAKATYALAQILGQVITDGSIGVHTYLLAGHRLDAETMKQWVIDATQTAPSIITTNEMFQIRIPFLKATLLQLIGAPIPKGSRRIPDYILTGNCHRIFKLGFLRGVFGGEGRSDSMEPFGLGHSADEKNQAELDSYFRGLHDLLAEFNIHSHISTTALRAKWPVYNKDRIAIKQVLIRKGILSAAIHELVGAFAGNGFRCEINLRLARGDQERFLRLIGFGGCVHKTIRAELAVTVESIKQRLMNAAESLAEEAKQIHEKQGGRWNECIDRARRITEEKLGNIGSLTCYWENATKNKHINKFIESNRENQTYSPLFPNDETILNSMNAHHIFDDSVEKKGKRDSMIIPSFHLLVVKRENLTAPKQVYDLLVPLTSSFIAQGLCVHNCFNQLDLPEYSNIEIMRERLLYALREGSTGFGFR